MPQAPSVARGIPFVEGTATTWPLKPVADECAGGQYPAETAGKPAPLGVFRHTKRRATEALTRHAHAAYNPCKTM
jgi:hypothetical protein